MLVATILDSEGIEHVHHHRKFWRTALLWPEYEWVWSWVTKRKRIEVLRLTRGGFRTRLSFRMRSSQGLENESCTKETKSGQPVGCQGNSGESRQKRVGVESSWLESKGAVWGLWGIHKRTLTHCFSLLLCSQELNLLTSPLSLPSSF